MSDLISRIQENEEFIPQRPVNEEKIRETEQQMHLTFAGDYKEFLQNFGAALLGEKEIKGICDVPRLSVVEATKRARNFFPGFPAEAYVIEELYIDHIITIQKADGKIYSYGPADAEKKIADSLGEYLLADL